MNLQMNIEKGAREKILACAGWCFDSLANYRLTCSITPANNVPFLSVIRRQGLLQSALFETLSGIIVEPVRAKAPFSQGHSILDARAKIGSSPNFRFAYFLRKTSSSSFVAALK